MKKMTVFSYKRDENGNIKEKHVLRAISVHSTFEGIGRNGVIIKDEFSRLAKFLEPSMEGYSVVDL